MRIAHVIDTLDPKQGGPPMIAIRIAAGQARRGHDVTLITSTAAEARERVDAAMSTVPGQELVQQEIIPDVRRSIPLLTARQNPQAARRLESLFGPLDVIHFHSVWCGISTLGASTARRMGKPYAYLLNGVLDRWSMQQSRLKKRFALATGTKRLLDDAVALHLGNEFEREGIAPLNLRTPIQRIIPNGVYLEELDPLPPADAFRRRHSDVLRDRPYVLFLSRLHYKKGLDYLADAFKIVAQAMPEPMLVVVGPEDGAGDDFRRRIREAGLESRVFMPGPLYGEQKLEALTGCSVFCLPSRQEGFSVAILEALACGCPCVITEGCHFPEVERGGAGLSLPLDAKAVADGIVGILKDPSLAQHMKRAARKLVEDNYTWDVVARSTITLYEDMLAYKTSRAR